MIVFIIAIIINLQVAVHIENLLFITILPFGDITVRVYFLKTEKHRIFVETVIHFERIEPYKYGWHIL